MTGGVDIGRLSSTHPTWIMGRVKRTLGRSRAPKASPAVLTVADSSVGERMKLVRQKGTDPELAVRRLVSALGVRYRIGPKQLPGRPDLANVSAGWAIFVHGCFWHSHSGCRLATVPKKNHDWWVAKLRGNVERDARKAAQLRESGLRVLVVWQCELRDPEMLTKKLGRFLRVMPVRQRARPSAGAPSMLR